VDEVSEVLPSALTMMTAAIHLRQSMFSEIWARGSNNYYADLRRALVESKNADIFLIANSVQ
jgi:hypothetical protein